MQVRKLIEELKKLDGDVEVFIGDGDEVRDGANIEAVQLEVAEHNPKALVISGDRSLYLDGYNSGFDLGYDEGEEAAG